MANRLQDRGLYEAAQKRKVLATIRLQDKFPQTPTVAEIVEYYFNKAEMENARLIGIFKSLMKKSDVVVWNQEKGTYSYKPPYNIRSASQLTAYFQSQTDTQGINVVDLKKGWPECDDAINKLEMENELLVLRNKKDNTPKFIYADDPSLSTLLEPDFVTLFTSIPLPSNDDVVRSIQQSGRTPAGAVAENKAILKPKAKARKSRQSTKQTNKHMAGLFKDYSALRQKGK